MLRLRFCTVVLFAYAPGLSTADVIPPHVAKAEERLRANPALFDRYDNFCEGKRPGDACTIAGTFLAGGGPGQCISVINAQLSTIDLTCVRSGQVVIDRGLPDGGFVHDTSLCAMKADATTDEMRKETQHINCAPLPIMPVDRFCKGKAVGSNCTVELTYEDRTERSGGICRQHTEIRKLYFRGRREARREIVSCEPDQPVRHEYKPVAWWQKLAQ